MRKPLSLLALFFIAGCQWQVVVPTAQELSNNRQLLADWQAKCDTGEYSHLAAGPKAELCSTTHDASILVLEAKVGKQESDFFGNMATRK